MSAIFQMMMNSVLISYNNQFCLVYLNDILVFLHTIEKHLKNLKRVLTALRKHKLYVKAFKCILMITILKFCDHIVERERVCLMFTKINAIATWLCFKNVHEMCQFLKLMLYYWCFIKHFAKIVVFLSNLLKKTDKALKKRKFQLMMWNVKCESVFQLLKKSMISHLMLLQLKRKKLYKIKFNTSKWVIDCVLMQLNFDEKLHSIAYDSCKLIEAELNYSVHKKKLLIIKHMLQTWNCYIDNEQMIMIVTDYKSLQYLQTIRTSFKRLAHWIFKFQKYNLLIKY